MGIRLFAESADCEIKPKVQFHTYCKDRLDGDPPICRVRGLSDIPKVPVLYVPQNTGSMEIRLFAESTDCERNQNCPFSTISMVIR